MGTFWAIAFELKELCESITFDRAKSHRYHTLEFYHHNHSKNTAHNRIQNPDDRKVGLNAFVCSELINITVGITCSFLNLKYLSIKECEKSYGYRDDELKVSRINTASSHFLLHFSQLIRWHDGF